MMQLYDLDHCVQKSSGSTAAIRPMSDQKEPLILAIETATRAGSYALCRGAQVLAAVSGNAAESHSTSLLERVNSILQQGGATIRELELLAVAKGPGSFTGLRIGLATVKALAVFAGKRVIGVSTLAAIAHAAGNSDATLSLLPAGRGEVFAQLFSVSDGLVREHDQAAHLSPQALTEKYKHVTKLLLAGEGACLHAELLSKTVGKDSRIVDPREHLAIDVAALALNYYRAGQSQNPEDLRALYVRPSDAEIKERWQQEQAAQSRQA